MTRSLTDNERKLWLKVARSVRPFAARQRPERVPEATSFAAMLDDRGGSPVTTTPARRANTAHPAHIHQPQKPKSRPPLDDLSNQRRIRRGQAPVDSRLDLHGHTQDSAYDELVAFVHREHAMGAHCLLIITGKGRTGSGILRKRFLDWIDGPDIRPLVAGYSQSHARHGGAGAFYLILKSRFQAAKS